MTKVAVALSGGVDSSVTAFLLQQQGYDVVGITAKTTNSAEAEQVIENARNVAEKLNIPFYPLDVTELFADKIIKYFENSYRNGETPNPCVMCNKYMKWGALYDYARNELNVDFVATGHYAKIVKDGKYYKLYPASDEHKDQLYFLFLLSQEHLAHTLFPLSAYIKSDVRKIAFENNLPSKSSKESQDICFIKAPMTTKKYLNNIFVPRKGEFIEEVTGKVLGEHDGFWQYTIGQRKGIGIAAPEPLYVTKIDAKTNTVFVGYKGQLHKNSLNLKEISWSYPVVEREFEALAKIRYNMKAVNVNVSEGENGIDISLVNPDDKNILFTPTKGQACVLYDKNDGHLLGGAFI